MKISKTEIIENVKVKCTFDVRHGASSTYYYIESLLDGSILHVGSGNANEEMSESEMSKYVLSRGVDFIRLSRYKDHVDEFETKFNKAIKIIENVSSSDSVFKEACLFLEEIKK